MEIVLCKCVDIYVNFTYAVKDIKYSIKLIKLVELAIVPSRVISIRQDLVDFLFYL